MFKSMVFFIFIFNLNCFQISEAANCRSAFTTGAPWESVQLPVRSSGESYSMIFRSNAPHYWATLFYFSRSSELSIFKHQGFVIGDLYSGNVGEIRKAHSAELGVIDVDDAGPGPWIGDFIRLSLQLKDFDFDLSKEALKFYRQGLMQKSLPTPAFITKDLQKSSKDWEERQVRYLDEMTKDGQFSKEAKLLRLDVAPVKVQRFFSLIENDLRALLKEVRILDLGYRSKSSGGSQDEMRFWVLIERKKNQREILEFKSESGSSVDEYNRLNGVASESFEQRMAQALGRVRPSSAVLGVYESERLGGVEFLMRSRLKNFVDLDPEKIKEKLSVQEQTELMLYLFNWLGSVQSQYVSADYIRDVNNLKSSEVSKLDQFVQDYSDYLKKQ